MRSILLLFEKFETCAIIAQRVSMPVTDRKSSLNRQLTEFSKSRNHSRKAIKKIHYVVSVLKYNSAYSSVASVLDDFEV